MEQVAEIPQQSGRWSWQRFVVILLVVALAGLAGYFAWQKWGNPGVANQVGVKSNLERIQVNVNSGTIQKAVTELGWWQQGVHLRGKKFSDLHPVTGLTVILHNQRHLYDYQWGFGQWLC